MSAPHNFTKFILLISVWIVSISISAQVDHAVVLKRKEGTWPLWNSLLGHLEDVTDFSSTVKGIPSSFKGSFRLWRLDLHLLQKLYESYHFNEPIDDKSLRYLFTTDTSNLCKCRLKHDVYILSAILKDKKIIAVDSDNNQDFSNDDFQEFSLDKMKVAWEGWRETAPVYLVNYERFNRGKVVPQQILIKVFPFIANVTHSSADMISVGVNEHRAGTFAVGNKSYDVALIDAPFSGDFLGPVLRFKESGQRFSGLINGVDILGYRLQDVVHFDDLRYEIERVSVLGDTLYLRFAGKVIGDEYIGFMINDCIPHLDLISMSGDKISSHNEGGSYTLYNFWGSWCGPCVDGMPEYVQLVSANAHKNIRFIGIAVDVTEFKARDFALKYKMHWPQVFESLTDYAPNSLRSILRVDVFPSYILVDPNGKILMRASKSIGYSKIKESLNSL